MSEADVSNLDRSAKNGADRESFVRFLSVLAADLKANPDAWENRDLGSFLEAMRGWIEHMEGYYASQRLTQPTNINWAFMTDVLMAARVYE